MVVTQVLLQLGSQRTWVLFASYHEYVCSSLEQSYLDDACGSKYELSIASSTILQLWITPLFCILECYRVRMQSRYLMVHNWLSRQHMYIPLLVGGVALHVVMLDTNMETTSGQGGALQWYINWLHHFLLVLPTYLASAYKSLRL